MPDTRNVKQPTKMTSVEHSNLRAIFLTVALTVMGAIAGWEVYFRLPFDTALVATPTAVSQVAPADALSATEVSLLLAETPMSTAAFPTFTPESTFTDITTATETPTETAQDTSTPVPNPATGQGINSIAASLLATEAANIFSALDGTLNTVTATSTPVSTTTLATSTPVSTPNPATSTPIPDLSTDTPTPTDTATETSVPTEANTRSPIRTATATSATRTPTVTPKPASNQAQVLTLKVTLLNPPSNGLLKGGTEFSWSVTNGELPDGYVFDPVFWQGEGDPVVVGRGYSGSTTSTRLTINSELFQHVGVDPGIYFWTIVLRDGSGKAIRVSDEYRQILVEFEESLNPPMPPS